MRKVIIGLILVAVALSGCGGPPKKTAQEIAWAALEAAAKIESYVFDSATNVALTAMAPQSGEMNVAFRGEGAVNNARREMRMKAAVRWETPEEGETTAPQEEEMEIYLLGGMTYMKVALLGMPTEWVKTQTPPGYWESLSPTEQWIELLEGAAVELLGEEPVDGVDSYWLRATPNLEKLWQMMMQELGQTGIEAERPDLGQVIKSFSVLYWIAKDTSFVTKVDTQMTLVMVSQEIGLPQEEGEPQVQEFQVQVEMSVSSRFSRYNQPVSIVLPPEAEREAEEAEARRAEFYNVSSAVIAMMTNNNLTAIPTPISLPANATNNMAAFPDSTSVAGSADKLRDPSGNSYAATDKNGYLLYTHDKTGDGAASPTVNYVNTATSKYYYTADADGTVHQWDAPGGTEYTY